MATQSDLDALLAAYRAGHQSVQYESKSVTFRSMDDMRAAIASLEAALGITQGRSITVRADKNW